MLPIETQLRAVEENNRGKAIELASIITLTSGRNRNHKRMKEQEDEYQRSTGELQSIV